MRAMIWLARTSELKSASNSDTRPEIWDPTLTVTMALSLPAAETDLTIDPRSILAVRYTVSRRTSWSVNAP
jgi:hypothetical protein